MDESDVIPYSEKFSLGANFCNFRRLIGNHENIDHKKKSTSPEIWMISLGAHACMRIGVICESECE